MRIDAHQHFWRPDRGDYGWLTPEAFPKLARDILPAELEPLLQAARIDRTILIQAAPTEAETLYLLELAGTTPFIAGVVGWVDFEAEDAPSRIARLCADPKLLGLRPMVQDIADTEWLLRPGHARVVEAMLRGRLRFDALIKPRQLPALAEFIETYPDLPVVIDHAAKPDIAKSELGTWSSYISYIANNSNAVCKLSGLATEAGPGWSAETLRPYVDVLLRFFGPSRLMWGSDWPVLTEAGSYAQWLSAAEALTAHLSEADRASIFGGTAAAFYGLA
ncbi:MAG: amidohydrolase family protein [Proteobacteria bacterium]|nr:amidohydrolase family protein [Pseudomonadota bacterium]